MAATLPARAQQPSASAQQPAVIVVQNDPAIALTGAQFTIAAGLDRQKTAQSGIAALVAECILRTPVGGTPLQAAIAENGGSIDYVVEGRDVRFYLEGLASSYGTALLPLLRAAFASPDFSRATVESARAAVLEKSARDQRLALTVGEEMLDRDFYWNSNAGLPQYGTSPTLIAIAPDDARAFFEATYRRAGAAVSAAGNTGTVARADFLRVLEALPAGRSFPVAISARPPGGDSRQLIAHRDIPVPWLVARYPAPSAASVDFGAMLVLATFVTRTLGEVAELPSVSTRPFSERGVGAIYNFGAEPANLTVYVDGGLGEPQRTFATALTVVNILGHAKMQGSIDDMKAAARGDFLQGAQTVEDRAWLAGLFAGRGTASDFQARALGAIQRTTASDLQRVAARYFGSPTVALVLPRSTQTADERN